MSKHATNQRNHLGCARTPHRAGKAIVFVIIAVVVIAGAAVAIKSLSDSARMKKEILCQTHLKQIALACINYGQAHQDRLPPDLDTLVKEGYIKDTGLLICPAAADQTNPSYAIMFKGKRADMKRDYSQPMIEETSNNHGDHHFAAQPDGAVVRIPPAP